MISFQCPSCKKQLSVKDELAGRRGSCPQCKKPIVVPVPETIGVDAGDAPSSPQVKGSKLDFLSPAKEPDELGRLGNYRVLKILGSGGMGMVLQAEDPLLKRSIALKVMRPEVAANETSRKRFLREARATAAIESDYIVQIHQVGVERNVPFIAMQFLKGEPLDQRLKRVGKLPIEDSIRIAKQTALGLAAAHEHGLIHRDIKPANIWLEAKTDRVKIVDFGLARAAEGDDVQITKTGTILGTPAYMAPEQARSEAVDHRSDLFSLGAVLYRMLTGQLPFKGRDTMSTLLAVTTETPKPVVELSGDVPLALSDLVTQLLAKEPTDRPESAQVVADRLAALEDDQTEAIPAARSEVRPAIASAGQAAPKKSASAGMSVVGYLLRQIVKLYRIPGKPGWIIKGTTAIVLLVGLLIAMSSSTKDRKQPEPKEVPPLAVAPFDAVKAKEYQERWAKYLGVQVEIENSIGMKLRLIPPGRFMMGSTKEEIADALMASNYNKKIETELPQHEVEITKPFYLGVYEVTQEQYQEVMGKNDSQIKDPKNPAELVIWPEAMEFCKRLSGRPEEKKAGRTYRLPSEAEWEYACRAGTSTAFHYGNSLSSKQANFNGDFPYGGAEKGPYLRKTVNVGLYEPNAFGLYDMHGNVCEWCLDGARKYQPTNQPVKDPRGPENASGKRLLRGGSRDSEGWRCRSANREPSEPSNRVNNIGFRVLSVLPSAAGGP
ncbi:MAG: hypothetical protein KatS3mg105_4033 [Gemmatales bacterium]|nr:MAG: hypothetical protein KatS3mg105_4033 [Gemmatales bacterium]